MRTTYKIILTLLIPFAVSCGGNGSSSEKQDDHEDAHIEDIVELTGEQLKVAGVQTAKIEQRQLGGTVKVNGVLDVPPQQLVSISVPLGGFVKNMSLLEGSRVRKGQVIAVIENLDFLQMQQDYLEAKSQLELSTSDYQRQQQLSQENVNSQKTLQRSKADFETWRAKFNTLKAKLRLMNVDLVKVEAGDVSAKLNLYSPINGYVTDVNVNIGRFVNPTDVLFEIVDTEHLHAELRVFEKDVPLLRKGQTVRFTLANEKEERHATVYMIGREIAADRTVQVHCHIDKEDPDLLPGMYLRAIVETGAELVASLPDEAVVDYQGERYLFVLDGSHGHEGSTAFQMIPVRTGYKELGFTQVLVSDSLINREFVVKGAYPLLSKLKSSGEEGHGH